MPDREAAIARLLRIADRERDWMEEIGLPDASSIGAFLRDVAEMLREQEPVEPKWIDFEDTFTRDKFKVPICGACESLLDDVLYCPRCGKKVKWDE